MLDSGYWIRQLRISDFGLQNEKPKILDAGVHDCGFLISDFGNKQMQIADFGNKQMQISDF
jgi:hypothetical protein